MLLLSYLFSVSVVSAEIDWRHFLCFRIVKTMFADSPLVSVDFMHDGVTLAVGSTRGKVFIYDLRSINTPVRVIHAHKSSVHCLGFQIHRGPLKVTGSMC
jgi:WD40 repeat protein